MQYNKIQTVPRHWILYLLYPPFLLVACIRIVHLYLSLRYCLQLTGSKHFVLGSSCGNQKEILHAVFITIICILLISNLFLIFVVCRMRTRSGKWVFILKAFFLFLILYDRIRHGDSTC